MEEVECTITGRVQGVMFRDFIRRAARSLGVVGTVKNCEDGSVRVVAQGSHEQLEALLEQLHEGPPLACVEDIDVTRRSPTMSFNDFDISWI